MTGLNGVRHPSTGFDIPPLVVTDLDGTLLDYRTRRVPDGFGRILDRILAAGSAFAVASGRPPASIRSLFPAATMIAVTITCLPFFYVYSKPKSTGREYIKKGTARPAFIGSARITACPGR